MSDSETAAYVEWVVAAVPELQPVLQEHLDDNLGELLPHVLFGDVTRWAQAEADAGNEPLQRLLTQLEDGLANGGPDVQGLVVASFVENVDDDSPLLGRLPDALLRQRQ